MLGWQLACHMTPFGKEFLAIRAWQKHKPERLFLRRSQATETASVETESTETYSKLIRFRITRQKEHIK